MITECDSAPQCCVSLADLDAMKLLTVMACMVAAYSAEIKTHRNHITSKSTATGVGIQGPLDLVGEYETSSPVRAVLSRSLRGARRNGDAEVD